MFLEEIWEYFNSLKKVKRLMTCKKGALCYEDKDSLLIKKILYRSMMTIVKKPWLEDADIKEVRAGKPFSKVFV